MPEQFMHYPLMPQLAKLGLMPLALDSITLHYSGKEGIDPYSFNIEDLLGTNIPSVIKDLLWNVNDLLNSMKEPHYSSFESRILEELTSIRIELPDPAYCSIPKTCSPKGLLRSIPPPCSDPSGEYDIC